MSALRCALLAVFLLVSTPFEVHAEGLPKEMVEKISRMVFDHIDQAKLKDGGVVGKEKAATLQYPLLPYDVREMIIYRGTISGMAEACAMNWMAYNFTPMMTTLHSDGKYDDYQLAFAGMLHGAAMTGGVRTMLKHKPCSDDIKTQISKMMVLKKADEDPKALSLPSDDKGSDTGKKGQ